MSHIVIIGGTGYSGGHIASEAARRGLARRFEVINFAVAAYGPLQRLETFRRKAAPYNPDLVVYVAGDGAVRYEAVLRVLQRLRTLGVGAAINDVTNATQEARALSRDIGRAVEAADEVRRL